MSQASTRDPVVRQRTRVIMVVHSHQVVEPIDCSADLVAFECEKTTKAKGRWTATLIPRRNYFNLLFPNDTVNFYIDPGSGDRGFVRTMMGFVDRVERSESTDDNGAVHTMFRVVGSDFQKAIDMTSIYFHDYMRQQLDARFHTAGSGSSRAGAALRTAGLGASGTPADFVENIMLVLLGFGNQWQMPKSYADIVETTKNVKHNRDARVQRAAARVPDVLVKAAGKLVAQAVNPETLADNINAVIAAANSLEAESGTARDPANVEAVAKLTELAEVGKVLRGQSSLLALRAAVDASKFTDGVGILDILDFDFIEALAIDGYQVLTPIWESGNSTLGQFLYGHSNEIINELIFDLRPVSEGGGGLVEGPYSTDPDELGINQAGTDVLPSDLHAVQYRPAVVFREYPYSTVNAMNVARQGFLPPALSFLEKFIPNLVHFGPIFAQSPNVPGRHTYTYPKPISPVRCEYSGTAKATKHLDTVVITNHDVKDSNLGRSDDDIFNIFAINPRNMVANELWNYRHTLGAFMPVINQISITRNGLRSREMSTEFSRYSMDVTCGEGGDVANEDATRRNLVRWHLLTDHWYQHNIEYLSGTITLRGMPEIRCGYRLDWEDRRESYYVESVAHSWSMGNPLVTTVTVSRGQRNDPFPAYIPPVFVDAAGNADDSVSGNRLANGRLAQFMRFVDTHATFGAPSRPDEREDGINEVDTPNNPVPGEKVYSVQSSPLGDQLGDE